METKTVLGDQEWMQDQEFGDWSLDWIQRLEFGVEFKELMPDWSTKITPLPTIHLNNSISFELELILLLPLFVYSVQEQQQQAQQQQLQQQHLDQDLTLPTFQLYPFDQRTDRQTSHHVIYNKSCAKSLPISSSWIL